jgi:hypothetical protein
VPVHEHVHVKVNVNANVFWCGKSAVSRQLSAVSLAMSAVGS